MTHWRRSIKSQGIYTVIRKKCQGSPCSIVEIFFSLVPWINTDIFNQFPTGGFKKYWHVNLNLWREKKMEICWSSPPEPGAIELLMEPQCLFKLAHCACKMSFTDNSPFPMCRSAAARSWGSMCVCGRWRGASQVSGQLLQGCPLSQATYGQHGWCEVWWSDSNTTTSLAQVFSSLSPATASQTSSIAPSQSPKHLSSPKTISQQSWKK